MIPKIIHYVWFGDAMPEIWRREIDHCRAVNSPERGWEVRVHLNPTSEGMPADLADKFDSCTSLVNKSDIMRAWLLWTHGGIYLDTDVIVLKPFDGLCALDGFILKRNVRFRINVGVCGAKPEHPFIGHWLHVIPETTISCRTSSGNDICQHLLKRGIGITLLGRGAFEPFSKPIHRKAMLKMTRRQQKKYVKHHAEHTGSTLPYAVHIGWGAEPNFNQRRKQKRAAKTHDRRRRTNVRKARRHRHATTPTQAETPTHDSAAGQ